MTIRSHNIDNLTMSLLSNPVLQDSFVSNPSSRLEALADHNKIASRHFGISPVELNEDERYLVMSLAANNIQQFYEGLAEALDSQVQQPSKLNIFDSFRVLKSSAA
jgi:hypothetical protein